MSSPDLDHRFQRPLCFNDIDLFPLRIVPLHPRIALDLITLALTLFDQLAWYPDVLHKLLDLDRRSFGDPGDAEGYNEIENHSDSPDSFWRDAEQPVICIVELRIDE